MATLLKTVFSKTIARKAIKSVAVTIGIVFSMGCFAGDGLVSSSMTVVDDY